MQLQSNLEDIQEAGLQVVAISYDSVEVLKRFAQRKSITFPLLSDPDSQVITAYGLLNQEALNTKIKGVPYPGTFLVDPKGLIKAKLFYDGYRIRHDSADLIKTARGLQ